METSSSTSAPTLTSSIKSRLQSVEKALQERDSALLLEALHLRCELLKEDLVTAEDPAARGAIKELREMQRKIKKSNQNP